MRMALRAATSARFVLDKVKGGRTLSAEDEAKVAPEVAQAEKEAREENELQKRRCQPAN